MHFKPGGIVRIHARILGIHQPEKPDEQYSCSKLLELQAQHNNPLKPLCLYCIHIWGRYQPGENKSMHFNPQLYTHHSDILCCCANQYMRQLVEELQSLSLSDSMTENEATSTMTANGIKIGFVQLWTTQNLLLISNTLKLIQLTSSFLRHIPQRINHAERRLLRSRRLELFLFSDYYPRILVWGMPHTTVATARQKMRAKLEAFEVAFYQTGRSSK